MKKFVVTVLAVLAVVLTLSSCGGGGPKAVAEKFLTGLYHLDFASAGEVSTPETKKHLEDYETMHQNDSREEARKIKVTVMEPDVKGEAATVKYKLSNDPTERTLKLVKKDGRWLAEWSKMDLNGAPMDSVAPGTDSTGTDMMMIPSEDTTVPAAPAEQAH